MIETQSIMPFTLSFLRLSMTAITKLNVVKNSSDDDITNGNLKFLNAIVGGKTKNGQGIPSLISQ